MEGTSVQFVRQVDNSGSDCIVDYPNPATPRSYETQRWHSAGSSFSHRPQQSHNLHSTRSLILQESANKFYGAAEASNLQPGSELISCPSASIATMNDERERQQRDLQRATELLEVMSREELVDMLHDILFNDRSDDTRKLSDWMAFQIIIQDETRDARKLLAQLGKVSAAHVRAFQDLDQVY